MAPHVPDDLAAAARAVPERPALEIDGAVVSYRSLDLAADRLASSFAGLGFAPGTRIGVVMASTALTIAGWWAARRASLAPVLLGARWTTEEMEDRLGAVGAEAVVADGAVAVPAGVARIDLRRLLAADGRPIVGGPTSEILVFTSGSTGLPKAVRLPDRVLEAAAAASARHLGHGPGDRWLTPLPLHHVGGLMVVVRSVRERGTAVLQARFDPARLADALARGEVRFASLVPTMLAKVLDGPKLARPRSLEGILLGGGPIPAGLLDAAAGRRIPVLPTYGMTETAGQVATRRPGSAADAPVEPLPGVDLRIVGDDGTELPRGAVGRIEVAGPMVAEGYIDGPTFEGRFLTPDLGRLDERGGLEVVGRADATIVTGGENVDPSAVERTIRAIAGVRDVVVVGIPDGRWGSIVGAVVALEEWADLETVAAEAKTRLGPASRPRRWLVAEVPRTELGKPDRDRVLTMLRSDDRGATR